MKVDILLAEIIINSERQIYKKIQNIELISIILLNMLLSSKIMSFTV